MKALKRVMASEYSRELSEKVFEGMKGMILRGLWAGSAPGYGLRRMLVSAEGKPKQIMESGDRKNLRSDRTILVPGPAGEIKWIHEIYRMFIEEKRSAVYIAGVLNLQNVRNGDRLWNNQSVLEILKNEKYTGSLVWGRWTQKLHTRTVPVAKEKWTVLPGALKAIVERKTFDAAQTVFQERRQNKSNEVLLDELRTLLSKKKKLTEKLLNTCAAMRVSTTVHRSGFHSAFPATSMLRDNSGSRDVASECIRVYQSGKGSERTSFAPEMSSRSLMEK
jgi:hypothetical protein